ncbi:hypothetical protein GALMADRAFT_209907 [Galerina marginata CBS 339.88]|uniref:Mid2 domain-containing protein n=1 Tax=Galerina marginata (strain CBS 339.88) TaxID=685588 RepID=A0A067T346_GALM3|nr:hypothetical protein GALMADRAFT_209907 [Galerina marginata CBS 339.88]
MSLLGLPFLLLFLTFPRSFALTNITIDDQDPLIHYYPAHSDWGQISESADAGGGHMLTSHEGVSMHFMSPLWPYRVTTALQFDDKTPVILDLQDHSVPHGSGQATASSRVVKSFIGTKSTKHTLRVSIPPGDEFAIVDMLIFEVLDPSTSSLTSTTTTQTVTVSTQVTTTAVNTITTSENIPASSKEAVPPNIVSIFSSTTTQPISTPHPSNLDRKVSDTKDKIKTIGMGVGIGLLALLLLLVVWCLYFQRTKRRHTTNRNRGDFVRLEQADRTLWRDTNPATSTRNNDGAEGFRYMAVPLLEQGGYPSARPGPSSQWQPQQGDGFDRQSSVWGHSVHEAPTRNFGYPNTQGQPPPDPPQSSHSSNQRKPGQVVLSWESEQSQPLKFIPII